jgi:mitochondrial splicing suppressor protein 51
MPTLETTNPHPLGDYYTPETLSKLWSSEWLEIFQMGKWKSDTSLIGPISPTFNTFHPFACQACKRGPFTGTKLMTCSRCKVVKFCSKEHQKANFASHKKWCKAFAECREKPPPAISWGVPHDMESWRTYSQYIMSQMQQKTTIQLHSDEVQIVPMQPRCRHCFKAGWDGTVLVSCPTCHGVALCKECLLNSQTDHTDPVIAFHGTDDPHYNCHLHLISLCCLGMIVEQGSPLAIESNNDCKTTLVPKDWLEYFSHKRSDFSPDIPPILMQMAPVMVFLTDGLSIPMTVHSALHEHAGGIGEILTVHILGATIVEEMAQSRYLELIRLNPNIRKLEIFLVGPNLVCSAPGRETDLHSCGIVRSNTIAKSVTKKDYYHNLKLDKPDVAILVHPGISDPNYTATWKPTLELLAQQEIMTIVTGYTQQEVVDDLEMCQGWRCNVEVPPSPNPFRGLRPFPDPLRDPGDFIFTNASYAIIKGKRGF